MTPKENQSNYFNIGTAGFFILLFVLGIVTLAFPDTSLSDRGIFLQMIGFVMLIPFARDRIANWMAGYTSSNDSQKIKPVVTTGAVFIVLWGLSYQFSRMNEI